MRTGMQLLCVQRLHGGLTIGDTHAYGEPFAFDVDRGAYAHLVAVVEEFLGRPLPAGATALGGGLQPMRRSGPVGVPDVGRTTGSGWSLAPVDVA